MTASTPPKTRATALAPLAEAARRGTLVLQRCAACGTVQYPPRQRCMTCLGDDLPWQEVENEGEVLAAVALAHSHEPYFTSRLPWPVASIRLDAGPVIIAHAPQMETGARAAVRPVLDPSGAPVLVARPAGHLSGSSWRWPDLFERERKG